MTKEQAWDKHLQIRTGGRDESNADEYHHPYEPTDYRVLERLVGSGLIGQENVVLDYGCGKGRVDFFLAYRTGAEAVGIEYDERICAEAMENRKTARAKADFLLTKRLEYARHLLLTSDKGVQETAAGSGFNNPLYFSQCFRRKYGMSPSAFRKKHSIPEENK